MTCHWSPSIYYGGDQAFFKHQYFAGDTAGDLGQMLTQEVKLLPNGCGYQITHTWGKILQGGHEN